MDRRGRAIGQDPSTASLVRSLINLLQKSNQILCFSGHDAKRQLQLEPNATGLDTACVYGHRLTAAVMNPTVGGALAAKVAAGLAITREDLGVDIIAVPAAEAYEKKA